VASPADAAASADARSGMVVVNVAVRHLGRGRQAEEDTQHRRHFRSSINTA